MDETLDTEWWDEPGERMQAGFEAASLRAFLADARLLSDQAKEAIKAAIARLDEHGMKEHPVRLAG